jgi:hypothetical protein
MPAREYAGGQVVTDQPSTRPSDPEPPIDASAGGRARPAWLSPTLIGAVTCLVLGFLSVLILPTLPGYDAFAWVVWGRELAHHVIGPHLPFVTGGGPSWKPFPVIFTTIFGFFGWAAPKLWVGLARAFGLFGLFIAYRLASRLAASERWAAAGPIAGVLAAFGVFLTAEWTHYMFRGTSEPAVVAATLFAIERHAAGRRTTAFLSGVVLALMRPEAGLFVGLYALWLFFADSKASTRAILVAGLLVIPLGWFVPPWIGSGQPFLSATHARLYNGNLGAHPELMVLKRGTNLTVWPVLIAAGAVALLAIRRREWLIVTLAAGVLGYLAVVEAMTADHYPGLERFLLPAAAVACVLAGVAVSKFAEMAGGGVRSTAVAVILVAVAVPFFGGRVAAARPERGYAHKAVNYYDKLVSAVHAAGGSKAIFPCGAKSFVGVNHTVATSLAWALGVPLTRVLNLTYRESSLHRPALVFEARRNPITGGAPRRFVGYRAQLIAHVGPWTVYRVTKPGHALENACVGT